MKLYPAAEYQHCKVFTIRIIQIKNKKIGANVLMECPNCVKIHSISKKICLKLTKICHI